MAHSCDACILSSNFVVDLLMIESRKAGSDVMALAHFKVFSEVLITAPPVRVDHTKTFVTSDLVEVGVANVVLLAVNWETTILVG